MMKTAAAVATTAFLSLLNFSLSCNCFSVASIATRPSIANRRGNVQLAATVDNDFIISRRQLMGSWGLSSVSSLGLMHQANAFDNRVSNKYDDRPKRRGPQPKDLGVSTRTDMAGEEYTGLKNCGAAPNCFCSTDSPEDDPEHNIPAWTWPKSVDRKAAFEQLEEVIQAYEPGQANIDGGGFKIITSKPDEYLYVQFESLKNGYIDDVEFAYVEGLGENAVQVRSSSRVGYLDFGVNARRLNYIAKALREKKGWTAVGVDPKTHPGYVAENSRQ